MNDHDSNGRMKRSDGLETDPRNLERASWRNWLLLVGVALLTTLGLATAIPPLVSERIVNPWPWAKTDVTLLVGLSMIMIVFVSHLTQEQRRIAAMQRRMLELQEESSRRSRQHSLRLRALLDVSHIMCDENDLQSVLDGITHTCVKAFGCQRASLLLAGEHPQELVVRSVSGHCDRNFLGARLKVGERIAGWVAMHRRPLLLGRRSELENGLGVALEDDAVVSSMIAPIVVRDELVGVVCVSATVPGVAYNEEDLEALQVFAENAGARIRQTEQADWMRRTIRRQMQSLVEKRRTIENLKT